MSRIFGTKTNRRFKKNYIINKKFQFRLISYFVGLFALTTLSLYGTSFLFFWRLKQKALTIGIPKNHVFFMFLNNQKYDLDILFISLSFLNLVILVIAGILISHRIAGPLFKLNKYLKNISPASEEFRLREKDFFKELEPVVNDLKGKMK